MHLAPPDNSIDRKKDATTIASSGLTPCVTGGEMRIYAAASTKIPIIELAAEFQRISGHTITLVFDTAGATEKRFLADVDATFLITAQKRISNAIKTGNLSGGVTHILGDTVGGFAAPAGTAKPDIETPDKLRAVLLAVPRIVFSDPARGATIGKHFLKVSETLGIQEEILKKSLIAQNGIETMRIILSGQAALGVTQISEIMQAEPSTLVGPFPKEFDISTTFSLWYRVDASPEAKAFVQIISGSLGREKFQKYGLRLH